MLETMRGCARRSVVLMGVLALTLVAPAWVGRAQGAGGYDGSVKNIRVAQDGEKTRLVFELSEPMAHRWFTLPQPARLVVDFQQDVRFDAEPSKVALPGASLVKALRAGRFRPGTVRMVIDLARPSKVSVFMIPGGGAGGHRMVIDVLPVKAGEHPTNVPPPQDVVTSDAAPPVTSRGKPLPEVQAREEVSEAVEPVRKDGLAGRSVQTGTRQPIVVLDAGHGGVDPGAHGLSYGLVEKNLTLTMAKRVRDELAGSGIKVIMTRDTDIFIPLPERGKIAQRAGADLFVSLHADSAPNRSVTGASVYMVSDRASDIVAQRLAERENSGDVLAGVALGEESKEVQSILISLVQRDTMNSSAYLGQWILNRIGDFTTVRKRNLMYAGFRVLKTPDVPSVLVEMGYLSNPREESALASAKHQKRLAEAIASGIRGFVNKHVHK